MASEFGKGTAYCLGLFLAHAERPDIFPLEIAKKMKYTKEKAAKKNASMWFYAAVDHLYDLEIPDDFPTTLKRRLRKLSKVCFDNRMSMDGQTLPEIKHWAIEEAKEILRLIDKFIGIDTAKAQWK